MLNLYKEKKMEGDVKINIITLGTCGVGKTSIINRIKDGTFKDCYRATIALDYFTITRNYENKNLIMSLNFHDTAGLEEFQGIIPMQIIRNAHIVLLVFCDINSLNDITKRWYKFYKKNANIENSRFILVGNKSDIFGDDEDEIIKQGQKFAEEIDAHFITCSAKSEDNMDNLERFIINEAKRFIDENEKILINNNKKVKLAYDKDIIIDNKEKQEKGKCC